MKMWAKLAEKYPEQMAKAKTSRKYAIRLKCLDCCCGNTAEVNRCEIKTCTLWPFRTGTSLYTKRSGNAAALNAYAQKKLKQTNGKV